MPMKSSSKKKLHRKQSAASAMFHDGSDRMRSSTGHSTLITSFSAADGDDHIRDHGDEPRRSSIPVLRDNNGDAFHDHEGVLESGGGKPSWWERPETTHKTCGQQVKLAFDMLVVIAIVVGLFCAAHFTQNRALPFIFAVLAALATFESTWLAYRLRLRLFLPFKLHQKQTCRDIYSQIMNYSVDLQTCAITPIAERFCKGRKLLAAACAASLGSGLALLGSWWLLDHHQQRPLVAYITLTCFLAIWCVSLSPNLRDATVLLLRYTYFALSTVSLLMVSPPSVHSHPQHAILEPFHLLVLCGALVLVTRALTSKDPMETVVMALLDISGLIYLACLGNVVNYLAATTAPTTASPGRHTIVFAVVFIIWSGEIGSFLMGKLLREAQFPWTHPLSKRLSSSQNVEKLLGALLFGVAASFVVTSLLVPVDVLPVDNVVFMGTSIVAICVSHVGKLWLISLKKVARVSATGKYLSIGDGVLDRLDSLLLASIVFTVVLRRILV